MFLLFVKHYVDEFQLFEMSLLLKVPSKREREIKILDWIIKYKLWLFVIPLVLPFEHHENTYILLIQFDRLIILMDQLDLQHYRVNVHVKEVSINRRKRMFFLWRRDYYILVDNRVKYQPFVDDLMYKLIQMEENIFQHLLLVDLLMVKLKIH